MSSQPWHLDERLAQRYAAGETGQTLAASIEQHLIGCSSCRARLTPFVDRERSANVFALVLGQVQAPAVRPIERFLRRCGLAESTARLLAVTPTLRGSWLSGVLFVLVLAQLAAQSDPEAIVIYMALAPVLPMISVAAAFGGDMDPAREMVGAAPYPQLRLLFLRAAAVVAATVMPAAAFALILPGSTWLALGWLMPSLALTAALILVPRNAVIPAAGVLSSAWMGLVAIGWLRSNDPFMADSLTIQLASASVLAAALVLILIRHDDMAEEIRRST